MPSSKHIKKKWESTSHANVNISKRSKFVNTQNWRFIYACYISPDWTKTKISVPHSQLLKNKSKERHANQVFEIMYRNKTAHQFKYCIQHIVHKIMLKKKVWLDLTKNQITSIGHLSDK